MDIKQSFRAKSAYFKHQKYHFSHYSIDKIYQPLSVSLGRISRNLLICNQSFKGPLSFSL